jgi:SOS-response transcriptional repressor LexA
MMGLTFQQRQLFNFIRGYIQKHDVAPSYDQMTARLGLASKSNIHRLLTALERRGYIRREPGTARAIVLVAPPSQFVPLHPEAFADRIIERMRVSGDLRLSAIRAIIVEEARSLNEARAAQ